MGSLSLLQQIFLTQELNWGLLNCRQILYQLSYQEIHYNNLAREKYATMLIGFTLKFINHNYSSACVLPRNYITFPWSTWAPSLLDNCFIPVLITLPPSSFPPPLHMITLLLFEGRTSPGPTTSTTHPSAPEPVHPAISPFLQMASPHILKTSPFLCILSTPSYSGALPFPPLSASGIPSYYSHSLQSSCYFSHFKKQN